MRISELLHELPIDRVEGPAESAGVEVTGVTHDSRRVAPGDLFVAVRGSRADGREYVQDAVAAGAVAVAGEGPAPPGLAVPWLETADPRALLGPVAARLHGRPDRALLTVGITGTNGKSSVLELVAAILEAAGRPVARLGTLGYRYGQRTYGAGLTTPEAADLFAMLAQMRDAGARAAVMEVSSHALALGRVAEVAFDLAIFTNLTRDHFDFHAGWEEYFSAKRRLFEQLAPGGRAAVNVDDPYGRRLAAEFDDAVTWGEGGDVDLTAATVEPSGSRAAFRTPRGDLEVVSPLVGRFHLANVAAAVAAGEALEISPQAIVEGIASCGPIPGRLEPVDAGQPFPVLIDFAHTPAALEAALRAVSELAPDGTIVVFGCGGDRDPGKREPMGRVAGELAGLAILTSDNPRRESPEAILEAVAVGLEASGARDYLVIPDRKRAIAEAIGRARPGQAVLIAGKGHESVQIVGENELPFSDRAEALAALEERFGSRHDR